MPILATPFNHFGLGATNPNPALISSLAAAIRQQEGYYPGSRAYRDNNPGNLMDPSGKIWPQYPRDGDEVIFPDPATGEAFLENDLSIKVNRGMSITSLLNMYAPASAGNNTPVYIANVSAATGIDPNVPLNQIPAGGSVYPSDLVFTATGTASPDPFGGDSGTSTLSMEAGMVSGQGVSTTMLVGLLLGGLVLYFYFRD